MLTSSACVDVRCQAQTSQSLQERASVPYLLHIGRRWVLARLHAPVSSAHATNNARPGARVVRLVAKGAQRLVQERCVGLRLRRASCQWAMLWQGQDLLSCITTRHCSGALLWPALEETHCQWAMLWERHTLLICIHK